MQEFPSTITSKGQVTIPKAVRERLGLSAHDRIVFVIEDDGTVTLRVPQYPTVASLAGAAGSLERKVTWAEMREIAREDHLAAKYAPKPCIHMTLASTEAQVSLARNRDQPHAPTTRSASSS
ncbi:MAG TPA: type II toxin-antitoxin system PrlF family antitoxin [Ktedonobacterales bacterium]|nr:type II toxin-antitoxin system PrlF family antitoxin [Ktedonobacterales bacterium]